MIVPKGKKCKNGRKQPLHELRSFFLQRTPEGREMEEINANINPQIFIWKYSFGISLFWSPDFIGKDEVLFMGSWSLNETAVAAFILNEGLRSTVLILFTLYLSSIVAGLKLCIPYCLISSLQNLRKCWVLNISLKFY